jgi:hypothetical protein
MLVRRRWPAVVIGGARSDGLARDTMTPAVLFWFYRDFEVCRERLRRLRGFDPGARVFALYGGPVGEAGAARAAVGEFVDDFYCYPFARSSGWKWRHGDQLIADWYAQRGRHLVWETVFIMQWDMLVMAPLGELFTGLKEGKVLLSGFRPLREVEAWWPWAGVRPCPGAEAAVRAVRDDMRAFRELLAGRFGYARELFACLFVVACLPRAFLERYVAAGHPLAGFLEYKLPTLARVFGVPVCMNHGFAPWWNDAPGAAGVAHRDRVLRAVREEVPLDVIQSELRRADGRRVFHPWFGVGGFEARAVE